MKAILDTSVLIAAELGRQAGALPEESAISVVTVAELHAGVLMARDDPTRARRLLTLARVEAKFNPLPIDVEIARVFATLFSEARSKGRRPKTMDMWIAATAVYHDLEVFSLDDDFVGIPRVRVKNR